MFGGLTHEPAVRLAARLAELAPPDLAAWRTLDPKAWEGVTVDDEVKDERTAEGMNAATYCLVKAA